MIIRTTKYTTAKLCVPVYITDIAAGVDRQSHGYMPHGTGTIIILVSQTQNLRERYGHCPMRVQLAGIWHMAIGGCVCI